MLRIVTLNANGLRAAAAKGVLEWLEEARPDIVCLQEVKAHAAALPEDLLAPPGWHAHYHFAQAKGYSGTAAWSRRRPLEVRTGFGNPEFDAEGRYVELRFAAYTVLSVYFPSGSSSPERQLAKFRFLAAFGPHLERLRAEGREIVLCGDVNIAHQEIDLKNWRSNQKNSGFTPEERAWLTELFRDGRWVDVFRQLDPRPERYTWWSSRGRARANNVGWRIDYQIATPGMAARAVRTDIFTERPFSDHAPLVVDYRLRA